MGTAFDKTTIRSNSDISAELTCHTPRFVTAMLQNVYLLREKTAPPVEHGGDFWYWKLTAYGLDLMRALVRASDAGFSYAETFMEPNPDTIPQLVLIGQVNAIIQSQIGNTGTQPEWAAILDHNPYLHDRRVIVDSTIFQREIDRLVGQIRQGHYDLSGSRTYFPPQRVSLDTPDASR